MRRRMSGWIGMAAAVLLGVSVLLSGCGGGSAAKTEEPAREEEAQASQTLEAEDESPAGEDREQQEPGQEGGAGQDGAQAPAEDAEAAPAEEALAEEVTLTLFAAKSLNNVMEDIIAQYQESHPGVRIVGNYDSSGTLMVQIEEGAECDVFFSAAQKQMDQLEGEGFLVEGTRRNVVNNQVVVVTWPGSGTRVTGLENLADAANMALADGSVPVGKYTRQALVNAGLLTAPADGDVSLISTTEVSEALGGLEINECANVGAVAAAVSEGSNEVGTVYYSDTCGLEDRLEILQTVSYDLTGNVIYPVAQTVNAEASAAQADAAAEFTAYIASEEAKETFRKYCFDTNVE